MALRKPLVLVDGQLQRLQSGDLLDAPIAAVNTIVMTNADEVEALVKCEPVYVSAAGEVSPAQADAEATTRILGLAQEEIAADGEGAIQFEGLLEATTGEWDIVTGLTGGLVVGDVYYLDPDNVGQLVGTAPDTAGDYVTEVGHAVSSTELRIEIRRPVLL